MGVLGTDNFSGAANAALVGSTADVAGGVWSGDSHFTDSPIRDGAGGVYCTTGAGVAYLGSTTTNFDESITLNPLTSPAGSLGLAFGDGAGNFVWVRYNHSSGKIESYRFNGASFTSLGTDSTQTVTTNKILRVTRTAGGTYTVYLAGVQIDTFPETTITSGKVGIAVNGAGSSTTGSHLRAFTASTLAGPLAAGSASVTGQTSTTISLTATDATGGTAPYGYQWHRSTTNGFTPGAGNVVAGATSLTLADTGLTPATTYYYVLTYTDAASGSANSTQVSGTTTAAATTITSGMLYDNALSGSLTDNGDTYTNASPFALLRVTTTATAISLVVHKSVNETVNGRIGIRVNGVDSESKAVPSLGLNTLAIDLTAEAGYVGGSNVVDLITGSQTRIGGVVQGAFLKSISFTGDSSPTFATPAVASGRVVVYGDSISNGAYADLADGTTPAFMFAGWTAILRKRLGVGSLVVEGYGGRDLGSDVTDSTTATAFAARLVAMQSGNAGTHNYWIAIGTNDYSGGLAAATFATRYGLLLDAIHAADSGAVIYCQSPLVRTVESANAGGSTLGDYRTAIQTLTTSRAFTKYINGLPIVALADISDAGVHPNATGHANYAGYVAGTLAAPGGSGGSVRAHTLSRSLTRSR